MAMFAITSFAQATQEYYRVEFTVPIVGSNTGTNNSVAATMKDDFTYCNPLHEYLDFPAGGNLLAAGTANDMGFRTTTSNVTETSAFYLDNGRVKEFTLRSSMRALEETVEPDTLRLGLDPVRLESITESSVTKLVLLVVHRAADKVELLAAMHAGDRLLAERDPESRPGADGVPAGRA